MSRAMFAAALLCAAPVLSGCGTFANVSVGARQGWKNALIYGGVRRDIQSVENWVDRSWTWGSNFDLQQDVGTAVGIGLVGIDVPLSAIGDTLTLPLTIPAALMSSRTSPGVRRDNPSPPAPPPPPPAAVVQPPPPPEPPPPNNASRSFSPSQRKAPDGSSPNP